MTRCRQTIQELATERLRTPRWLQAARSAGASKPNPGKPAGLVAIASWCQLTRPVTAWRLYGTRDPPTRPATWSPRRLTRAALNWLFRVRSQAQPTPSQRPDLPMSSCRREVMLDDGA